MNLQIVMVTVMQGYKHRSLYICTQVHVFPTLWTISDVIVWLYNALYTS